GTMDRALERFAPKLALRVVGEDVVLGGGKGVAGSAALGVVALGRMAGGGGGRECAGPGVVVKHRETPALDVAKTLAVLYDKFDFDEIAGNGVRSFFRKWRRGDFFRLPFELYDLRAVRERLAVAGDAVFVGFDHRGIGDDDAYDAGSFGKAGADDLPLLVAL